MGSNPLRQHSEHVRVDWDGEWWTISDEDGEFARATSTGQAMRYISDLMHGPGTGPWRPLPENA